MCVCVCVRVCVQVDTEVASAFKDLLTKQGMTFKLGTKVTTSSVSGDSVTLTVEPSKGGAAESIEADVVRARPCFATTLVGLGPLAACCFSVSFLYPAALL